MIDPRHQLTPTLLFIALSLSGCEIFRDRQNQADSLTDQTSAAIEGQINDAAHQLQGSPIVRETTSAYFGTRIVHRGQAPHSIASPKLSSNLKMIFVEPVTVAAVARLIASRTGIKIKVDADIATTTLPDIYFDGTAAEALNQLTERLGYAWRTENNSIRVFATTSRIWKIYAPLVTSAWRATVGLSGTAQSGSGGSDLRAQDQVVVSMDNSTFWDQLENTVRSLLSPAGRHTLDRSSAELLVIDTPTALDRVHKWVSAKNISLATQVVIAIDLYEIERSTESGQGFNFEGVLRKAFGDDVYSIDFSSDDTGSLVGFQFKNNQEPKSDTTDIAAILRNAAADGKISKLTSTVVRGLNGQPVPLFFGDERSYLERRDVVTEEGITSVRLVPGKLQDGIALNILPNVLPDTGQLMLNITMRTTRIKAINRFPADAGPNDPVIQLPDLESRSVLLPVMLQTGETLFVAGLDTTRASRTKSSGILSRSNKTETRRASLVMLITPRIIPPPLEITASSAL